MRCIFRYFALWTELQKKNIYTCVLRFLFVLFPLITISETYAQISLVGSVQSGYVANSSTISISKPSGIQPGDVMIINLIKHRSGDASAPTLTGWNVISGGLSGTTDYIGAVLYRVADGTEGTSFTINLSNNSSVDYAVGALSVYTGVDRVNPFDISPGSIATGNSTGTSLSNVSSITTQTAEAYVILMGMSYKAKANSTPSTLTMSVTNLSTKSVYNISGTRYVSVGCVAGTLSNAGATGYGVISVNKTSYFGGILLALRPQKIFRSINSGNWNEISTWQQSTDVGSTWSNATSFPNENDGLVTIQSGHVVSLIEPATCSNLTLYGTLNMNSFVLTGTDTLISNSGSSINIAGINNFPSGFGSVDLNESSTVNYVGATQTISPQTYGNITFAAGTKNLSGETFINGALTINAGVLIKLGSNNLTLGSSSPAISGTTQADAMIVADDTGELRKQFASTGSYTFPIGDNADGTANYTPLTVVFTSGTFGAGAYIGVKLTDAKQPQNISQNNYLTRYWSVSQSGISSFTANISALYDSADDVVGDPSLQYVGLYSNGSWFAYSPLSDGFTATDITDFGDFTGISLPVVSTNVSSVSDLSYNYGYGPSLSQSITISGVDLEDDIVIVPPDNYEISLTDTTGFQSTRLTIPQSGRSVNAVNIFVRLKEGLEAGNYNVNMEITSTGATTNIVSLSGSVALPVDYCSMSGNTTYETSITSVSLNTLLQLSAKPSGYSDFTTISTDVYKGQTYNLNVKVNTDGNYQVYTCAWIDWNHDGDFSDDGEYYDLGSATNTADGLTSASPCAIVIPINAIWGTVIMRIATRYSQYPTLCETNFDGEVEDYSLNIVKPTITTGNISGSPFAAGDTVNVPFTVDGSFIDSNLFTLQLSDTHGDFSSPVNIGTLSGISSASIQGSIPVNTSTGTGYRMRVIGNNPVITGTDNWADIVINELSGVYMSPSALSGFTYQENLGPSDIQSFTASGYSLNSNLRLELVNNNFEISTSNIDFSGVSVINLPVVSGIVAPKTVYARLKSGLSNGIYSDSIKISADGYPAKYLALTGIVTKSPNITVSESSLSFSAYNFGGGPSDSQSFTLRGSLLAGTVIVTPAPGFEIATISGGTYQSTEMSYSPDYGEDSLLTKTIYVRMKSGLSVGINTGELIVSTVGSDSKVIFCSGFVNANATIQNSTSYLGAFIYTYNEGPSTIQGFKFDVNNLSSGSTITIIPPVTGHYEIAESRTGAFKADTIQYLNLSENFSDSIFVRLASGLSVGIYDSESLILNASGAVTKSIACTGKVTSGVATLYTSIEALSGFGYRYSSGELQGIDAGGPSNVQSFILDGISLINNVTVTAPANFEISNAQSGTYSSNILINTIEGKVGPATIYIRLKAGLDVGLYSGNITIESLGATTISVACRSGQVYASPLISADGGGDYCIGSTVSLTSSGDDIQNRYWEGPNNFYSTNQNLTLSTNATESISGNYVVTGNVPVGGNLIFNGNFESGNVGFGSAYGYPDIPFTTSSLVPEGLYAVTTTGSTVHNNFNDTVNHTSGGSLQMIINGNTIAGAVVWTQSAPVIQGADYEFSYWLQTVVNGVDPAPSKLQLYVNGVAAGDVYTANPNSGTWTQYIYNINSGTSNIVNLELINQTTEAGGNDFALDDIQFRQVLCAKDTVTVAVQSEQPVSLTISTEQETVIEGTPVTFTASPVNGGTSPAYTWKVNGIDISNENSNTYTYIPATGDSIQCILTSSIVCATGNPAISNAITMVVNAVERPNYWLGITDTNWANASNWTNNTIPDVGENIEFATIANYGQDAVRDLLVDDVRIVGNIINSSSHRLVIPAGTQLVVNSNVQFGSNPDLILIKADSLLPNGSLVYNNTSNNPVYATVEMYSPASWNLNNPANNRYNWQFFGIPVQSLNATPTFNGAYIRKLLEYETDTTTHWQTLNNNSVLEPFCGYELCQKSPRFYTVKGKLVNSDFDSGQLAKTSGALYSGQHLFANPYTAAINVKQIEFGPDMVATVYLYNTGSFLSWRDLEGSTTSLETIRVPGQYTAIPQLNAGEIGIPGQVPSMSSMLFMVNSAESTPNCYVNLNYTAVVTRNTDLLRTRSTTVANNKVSLRIDVVGKNYADQLWLFAKDSCSGEFDNGYDGFKIRGSALQPQLFTVESDGEYQINTIDNIDNTIIGFIPGQDTKYTFTFNVENLNLKYDKLYLYDVRENSVADVTESGTQYSFETSDSDQDKYRFRLYAKINTDNFEINDNVKVFVADKKIMIKNFGGESGDVYIYNVSGKMIDMNKLGAFDLLKYSLRKNVVYIVKIVMSGQTKVEKVVLF
ncbi:MAG: GEVED domain-containing protein [Paludibacter sp.]|nr:GEVED domain-containing protein [Paludibacter sp.]